MLSTSIAASRGGAGSGESESATRTSSARARSATTAAARVSRRSGREIDRLTVTPSASTTTKSTTAPTIDADRPSCAAASARRSAPMAISRAMRSCAQPAQPGVGQRGGQRIGDRRPRAGASGRV